jgi:hypothetical protein
MFIFPQIYKKTISLWQIENKSETVLIKADSLKQNKTENCVHKCPFGVFKSPKKPTKFL